MWSRYEGMVLMKLNCILKHFPWPRGNKEAKKTNKQNRKHKGCRHYYSTDYVKWFPAMGNGVCLSRKGGTLDGKTVELFLGLTVERPWLALGWPVLYSLCEWVLSLRTASSSGNVVFFSFVSGRSLAECHNDWKVINEWVWIEWRMCTGWLETHLCKLWKMKTQKNEH